MGEHTGILDVRGGSHAIVCVVCATKSRSSNDIHDLGFQVQRVCIETQNNVASYSCIYGNFHCYNLLEGEVHT